MHSKVMSALAVMHAVRCNFEWAFGAALWRMVILSWLQTASLYFQMLVPRMGCNVFKDSAKEG